MGVDWGVVATIVVVVKGLWDILRERHKPALDLSALDSNIAQAAHISVQNLLEAMAQLQKRLDNIEKSEKRLRQEVQDIGYVMVSVRHSNDELRSFIERLLKFSQGLLGVLREHSIESDIEQATLERFRAEFSGLPLEPK